MLFRCGELWNENLAGLLGSTVFLSFLQLSLCLFSSFRMMPAGRSEPELEKSASSLKEGSGGGGKGECLLMFAPLSVPWDSCHSSFAFILLLFLVLARLLMVIIIFPESQALGSAKRIKLIPQFLDDPTLFREP